MTVAYYLFGFTVSGMHPTGSAELSQFETLSIVLFVLRGRVVAVLAVGTSQRNNRAILFAFTSHVFLHRNCVLGTHPLEWDERKERRPQAEYPLREGILKRNAQTVKHWLAPGESVPLDNDTRRDIRSSR